VKIAINFSQAACALRDQGRLAVDLFKCPDWPDHWDAFAQAGPVYIHFRHMAGAGRMRHVHWRSTASMRKKSATPFVNLHIAPYLHWLREVWPAMSGEPLATDLYALARDDIEGAARKFGAENIIIENAPYRDPVGTQARAGVDPEFLCRLTAETDCGFLLDLAHARISARQLGIPEEEYIRAMPLDRLRELHITGLLEVDGILQDHFPMMEEDWPSVEWAFHNIRQGLWSEPWVMTYEYGGIGPGYAERTEAGIIESQMKRFSECWQKSAE
jgi:uncharacterized protein